MTRPTTAATPAPPADLKALFDAQGAVDRIGGLLKAARDALPDVQVAAAQAATAAREALVSAYLPDPQPGHTQQAAQAAREASDAVETGHAEVERIAQAFHLAEQREVAALPAASAAYRLDSGSMVGGLVEDFIAKLRAAQEAGSLVRMVAAACDLQHLDLPTRLQPYQAADALVLPGRPVVPDGLPLAEISRTVLALDRARRTRDRLEDKDREAERMKALQDCDAAAAAAGAVFMSRRSR